MEGKKNHYFYIIIGYIGALLIFLAGIRYIFIIDDIIGRSLITFGIILILSSLRFMESKFLTVKEKRIVNWAFVCMVVVILLISLNFAR